MPTLNYKKMVILKPTQDLILMLKRVGMYDSFLPFSRKSNLHEYIQRKVLKNMRAIYIYYLEGSSTDKYLMLIVVFTLVHTSTTCLASTKFRLNSNFNRHKPSSTSTYSIMHRNSEVPKEIEKVTPDKPIIFLNNMFVEF